MFLYSMTRNGGLSLKNLKKARKDKWRLPNMDEAQVESIINYVFTRQDFASIVQTVSYNRHRKECESCLGVHCTANTAGDGPVDDEA